jgi:glycosyltransferase involved in cell wall biosynthesis
MSSEGANPRVLLVCEWFVKYTTGLARGLADAGCEVTLLSRDHDLEFGDEPGAMRDFVATTLDGRARHLEIGGRVRELSRLPDVWRLRRLCKGWEPDVVHVQDSLAHDLRLALAAGFPRSGYGLTIHDPSSHPGDPDPSRRIAVARRVLRQRAEVVFVHSRVLADELRAAGEVRGAVEVIPLPFVGEVAREPLPERPALLFFGRISHYKGLDTLLDAMPAVWERFPETTLTVAGEGSPPESQVLGDPRVSLLNEHVPEADVAGLFAAATCVVLPYRQASQSGVGSAAKQYGRAMVATDVGGLPELVGSEFGRVVRSEDPSALAAAVVEVLGTPGLAETMGRRAAEDAAGASWANVSRQTLAAYREHLL